MKLLKYTLVLLLFSNSLFAQIDQGISLINAEMFVSAKKYFKLLIEDPTLKSEACYYMGEIYLITGNTDSASWYYETGIKSAVPNALCMVGKAGLVMKNDAATAADMIKKAGQIKEYKKNPALPVAIAKAYAFNKQFDKALETLSSAKELNKNYTDTYLIEGDIYLELEKPGDAAGKYESAITMNAKCKEAYYKVAWIYYRGKLQSQSIEYLNKLLAIDANFPPALKLLGDIYYDQGKYAKTAEYYAQYLQSDEAELNDRIRYAYALHFNKEYNKSIEEIRALLPSNPDKPVLKRILAYNFDETSDNKMGIETIRDFFNSVNDSDIISSDYRHYAFMLQKDGQDSLAIINFEKAMKTSSTPVEYYKEIATSYEKMKKYSEAVIYYKKHVSSGKNIVPADLLYWGRDCYFAASAIDSASIAADSSLLMVRSQLYHEADSVFGDFSVRYPEHYMGYFWRARVNAILDPETETGLAKPYYEKVVEILEKSNTAERRKELVESYQYLGYYSYLKADEANSLLYFNKILAVDPENSVAKQAIEGMQRKN